MIMNGNEENIKTEKSHYESARKISVFTRDRLAIKMNWE